MPDFGIENLAKYLHLAPQQVARLADRGKLPGRKVAGQWRFARADIHHWLEERIGLAEEDIVDVHHVLRRGENEQEIRIAEILPVEAVAVPLAARTKNSVITSMVKLAEGTGILWDAEKMTEAIRSREELYPTAMENGVALLHPRRPMTNILAQAVLALGVAPSGIPFGSDRGALTDVFFLICSVDDRGHLQTLARLSRILASPGFLDSLRTAADAPTAHQLLASTESELK
ncbi:MAG: PTS sugar transporter subunit IIA [Thermoguttaceae bacterium]